MAIQLHWSLRFLAFLALAFCLVVEHVNQIPRQDFCNGNKVPPAILTLSTWAGICHPETKTFIPVLLTTTELTALAPVARQLPNPTEMINNRIEIGKISVALLAIGTPEAQMMVEAIENYDEQAKKTIRSLAKLSYQSTLAHKSLISILSGIIDALVKFPQEEVRAGAVQDMIQSRQYKIDAWVRGFQDALRELYLQAQAALHNLDANDLHLKQILQTSGRTKGQQEAVAAQGTFNPGWGGIIFGAGDDGSVNLRPPVEKAISNLEALIDQSSRAREVVGKLSYDVQKLSTGIEAARKYSDGMIAVEMKLDSEVEVMVDLLRKLRGEAESESFPPESE